MKQKLGFIAFNKGEFDQATLARIDLEGYSRGAEIMENIVPLVQGGMRKAPGTEHFGLTAGNVDAMLYPFVFSQDEAFAIEVTDQTLRIHSRAGIASITGADATLGAWADESGTVPSGGSEAPSGGGGGVTDSGGGGYTGGGGGYTEYETYSH